MANLSAASADTGTGSHSKKDWQVVREGLAPYAQARTARSLADITTSVVPYLVLSAVMYLSLQVSYLITLGLAVPTAGFLVRTFIVFHDCTHGSFFPGKRANTWVGTAAGLLTFSSFACWRHAHLVHHGTAGDLDRRGVGDLPTKTVAEYRADRPRVRLAYRVFRHPLVMFGVGPFVALIVQPRIVPKSARPRIKRRVHATNLALVGLVGGICWLIGWEDYLLIELPTVMLAGAAGIWLFFVQHQFEDVYWAGTEEWSYADAALRGSSYLKLPQPLQFFTGNIGLHHVHHLNPRIPNYNLQRAHDENAVFDGVPVLTLRLGLRAVRLKLYDTDKRRMVTFAQAGLELTSEGNRARSEVEAIVERARAEGIDPARVIAALGATTAIDDRRKRRRRFRRGGVDWAPARLPRRGRSARG
jgi:acyl-lipid omega-6 desaturase (Delta-12 desaturase)